jgi:hypothetical protein
MNKFLVLLFTAFLVGSVNAQLVITFSKEKDRFLKELNGVMTNGKIEKSVNTFNAFEKLTKEGKVPDGWFSALASTCNLMAERNMSALTHYEPYIEAVVFAAKAGKTDAQFLEWTELVNDVIDNQKKGDNGQFLKMIDFSASFFSANALNITSAKAWKVTNADCKMVFEDGKAIIRFANTGLLGCVRGDTVSIQQTSGDYLPVENRWDGKNGKVDWKRASLDPSKVYATLKKYSISLTNFNYSIDTVTFYHTEYFKTPLIGRLTDKMVSSADSNTFSYPRFESYTGNVSIKDIAPNVTYSGGFSLFGSKVIGSSTEEEKAALNFFARDGKTRVLTAKSNAISIKKGEELGAEKAEVSIYFGADSIYHPQLNVVYKVNKREIRLLRGETGMGKAKFIDSYHNHEFQTDAIFWNLDSSVLNLKILQGQGKTPGIFESVNYFQKEIIRKLQGQVSYDPLSILKKTV